MTQIVEKDSVAETNEGRERIVVSALITLVRRGQKGRWQAEFHWNGQHCRRSMKTGNLKVARQCAQDLETKLRLGEGGRERSVLITDAVEQFLNSKRTDDRAHKTLVKYEGELQRFAAFAAQKNIRALQRITVSVYDAYKQQRQAQDHLDAYTLYNHAVIVKTWLKWCKRRQLLAVNPLADLEVEKPRRRRHPAPNLEQVQQILGHAHGELLAVLAMLAFTGLRSGELVMLRPADVDLDAAVIHVRPHGAWQPKTVGSQRDVPIHPRLGALLKAFRTLRKGKQYFFPAPACPRYPQGEHHLNYRQLNEQFKTLAQQIGMTVGRKSGGVTEHALRRFFKTLALNAGVPKPLVDGWLGHCDQQSMDYFYYRLDAKQSALTMAKLNFGPAPEDEIQRASR